MNEELRQELLAMKAEDVRVRNELVVSGELGGTYVPCMEEVHRKNAARLRVLIEVHDGLLETLQERTVLKPHG